MFDKCSFCDRVEDMEKKHKEDYDALNNRIGSVEAFLDELLDEVLYKIEGAINAEGEDRTNDILLGIHNYSAGVADGNRFNRPCPYSDKNPKVFKRGTGAGRILGCQICTSLRRVN